MVALLGVIMGIAVAAIVISIALLALGWVG